jgi:hypothetical protein
MNIILYLIDHKFTIQIEKLISCVGGKHIKVIMASILD